MFQVTITPQEKSGQRGSLTNPCSEFLGHLAFLYCPGLPVQVWHHPQRCPYPLPVNSCLQTCLQAKLSEADLQLSGPLLFTGASRRQTRLVVSPFLLPVRVCVVCLSIVLYVFSREITWPGCSSPCNF